MKLKGEYIVSSMSDLDDFDGEDAHFQYGTNFVVYVMETQETWEPVFCYRENGDIDGFMGWK